MSSLDVKKKIYIKMCSLYKLGKIFGNCFKWWKKTLTSQSVYFWKGATTYYNNNSKQNKKKIWKKMLWNCKLHPERKKGKKNLPIFFVEKKNNKYTSIFPYPLFSWHGLTKHCVLGVGNFATDFFQFGNIFNFFFLNH